MSVLRTFSLEARLNLSIALITTLIILLGSVLAVLDAQESVRREAKTSVDLALGLIDAALMSGDFDEAGISRWMNQLGQLDRIRHLRITVTRGEMSALIRDPPQETISHSVPDLFRWGVMSSPLTAVRLVGTSASRPLSITVESNAEDEIREAWAEFQGFLYLQGGLLLMISWVVHFIASRALRPVGSMLRGLSAMEQGDYETRLPAFGLAEMDRLSQGINHLSVSLQASREENRALTRHSLRIQEEERRSIAQEIHDEFGQNLTAIKMMSGMLDVPERGVAAEQIRKACDRLFGVVRSLLRRLRPQMLEDLGLKAAVEDLISSWQGAQPDLRISLSCDPLLGESRGAVSLEVYRIIQEALTNTVRHSSATEAEVRIEIGPARALVVTITDNGRGMEDRVPKSGFGLLGIRERVASLKGQFALINSPGAGLELRVVLPELADEVE